MNEKKNWVTHSFTENLIEFSKKNKKIIVLDADLSDDLNLKQFSQKFPSRFIQNGIAEQDMVSMAGGIALSGLIPVVNSFASFLTSRANEQIYNNSSENSKIIYISLYAGLLPAGAGKSHQSLRDISLLSSIPNFKIYQPLNYIEVNQILRHCIFKEKQNCAIRLSIGPPSREILNTSNKISFRDGVGSVITEGKSILIFSYGQYIFKEILNSTKFLRSKKIFPTIINMSSLNKFNKKWLKMITKNYKHIFSIDDHSEVGGLGDNLLNELNKLKVLKNKTFLKIGLKEFPKCGTIEEVLKYHQLDAISLAKIIIKKIHSYEN